MLKGYRGILFALGLAAFVTVSGGAAWLLIDEADRLETVYEQQAKAKADDYTSRARVAAESRCRPLAPEAEHQCISEEAQTARQGQHDEYDLQAQLVTSAWTRTMGVAAVIGMAIGILGVGLIFVTFRETRRAADAAQRTFQAFVAVEDANLVPTNIAGRLVTGTEEYYTVYMSISNVGRSVARVHLCTVRDQRVLVESTLEPGATYNITDSFRIETGSAFPSVEGCIVYSTALYERAQLSFKAILFEHERQPSHVWGLLNETVLAIRGTPKREEITDKEARRRLLGLD